MSINHPFLSQYFILVLPSLILRSTIHFRCVTLCQNHRLEIPCKAKSFHNLSIQTQFKPSISPPNIQLQISSLHIPIPPHKVLIPFYFRSSHRASVPPPKPPSLNNCKTSSPHTHQPQSGLAPPQTIWRVSQDTPPSHNPKNLTLASHKQQGLQSLCTPRFPAFYHFFRVWRCVPIYPSARSLRWWEDTQKHYNCECSFVRLFESRSVSVRSAPQVFIVYLHTHI